jgi:hypothetical protein
VAAVALALLAPACRRKPSIEAAPETPPPFTGMSATCAKGWYEPPPGSPYRTEPLDALRAAQDGLTGSFQIVEMRHFLGPGEERYWYAKVTLFARQPFKVRFLYRRGPGVVAVAPFDTKGFAAKDWKGVGRGARTAYPGIDGQWPGEPTAFTLPADLAGCVGEK